MNRLKKIVMVFLILVIVFPSETGNAFSFLPKFFAHYHHHNAEHHQVSVLQFIREHFAGENEHYKKEHHDEEKENCPFSFHHSSVPLVYIFRKEPDLIFLNPDITPDNEKSELPDYRFTFSEYNGSIWQPPKIG